VAERPVVLPPAGGSFAMPGDPKECRAHAMRCAELAAAAKTEQLRATLLELSRNWVKLAEGLETTHTFLDQENVDFKKPA